MSFKSKLVIYLSSICLLHIHKKGFVAFVCTTLIMEYLR